MTGKPTNQAAFRFAGVELRPEDTAQDKLRDLTRSGLWKHLGASILIGAGLALLLLLLEKSLAANYFLSYRLPEPYPYLNHGLPLFLLFFYVGWAVYWGIRDVMDDQPGVARSRIFWWRRDPARGAHMKERSIGAGASLALALLAQRLYEAAPSGAQKVIALIVLGACGVMALGFGLIFATIVVYSLCGGGSTDL